MGGAAPLGHDEARYATDTRQLVRGEGKRYVYVPVGMNVIATPGILMGGDERALRFSSLLVGVLFLLAAWCLARRLTDPDSARWVVGVLAGAHPMVRVSADLLSDLPSAACLLAALAILIPELTRRADGPRPRIVAAAPLFAAAFYVRYGSCVTIAIVVVGSLIMGARAIAQRPAPVIAMLSVLAILLVPHVVHSVAATGSPIGILLISAGVPGKAGEGLATYLTGNVFATYGVVVAPLMVAGLLKGRRDRTLVALQLIALAQIVVLGLTTHGQSRFVVLATVLLVIAGVDASRRAITATTGRLAIVLATVATIAVVASWVGGLYAGSRAPAARAAEYRPTIRAAAAIRADAKGAACEVLGRQTAQLDWYTGCRSTLAVPAAAASGSMRVYAVRAEADGPRPAGFDSLPGVWCPIANVRTVEVVRLRPSSTGCATSP